MIRFNEVTWYSKLATVIVVLGVMPAIAFYIGREYQEVANMNEMAAQISQNGFVRPNDSDTAVTEGCEARSGEIVCNLTFDNQMYTFSMKADNAGYLKTIAVSKGGTSMQTLKWGDPELMLMLSEVQDRPEILRAIDIDFDGHADLQAVTCAGATGNVCFEYYLFDPRNGRFDFSEEFSGTGGVPDANTKTIQAHWNNGCAGGCYTERTYKVENGRPVLIKEVSQTYDSEKQVFINVERIMVNGEFMTATTTVTY